MCRAPEYSNKLIPIHPIIEFECVVRGRQLTATITHAEENILETSYHITFSDGHKNEQVPYFDGYIEGFGRLRDLDPYEAAIYNDLCALPMLADGGRPICLRINQGFQNTAFNVWVLPAENETSYDVHFKGEYQFSLYKHDLWQFSTRRGKSYVIDRELAARVAKHLDTLS